MFNLSSRCVQYTNKVVSLYSSSLLPSSLLFTLVRLRNYVSLTTAVQSTGGSGSNNSEGGGGVPSTLIKYRINNSHGDHLERFVYIKPTTQQCQQYRRLSSSSSSSTDTEMANFKEFCMMDYDIIGFDLDGTLLRYNLEHMVPLEYELLVEYLVKRRNYPRALLDKHFDSDFVQKGLIVDADRGNLLKLSSEGVILKACHGTRFLSTSDIEDIYGKDKKWNIAQDYIKDPLSAWNGPVSEKLRTLLDYFDISSSLVFAHAVDALDNETTTKTDLLQKQDYKIWPDILSGLINMYTREHFALGESAYFEALKKNPEKYLLKTNEKVIKLLQDLRSSGKALYLLTGSNIDFANFTASYALGPNWKELFNCIISFGKKPGFFHMQRQFLQIQNLAEVQGSEIALDEILQPTCYSQGNWQQLKESLSKRVIRKDADTAGCIDTALRCLYVGDNLIQDVYAPFSQASMDSIALCEELLENDHSYEYNNIVKSSLWGSYFSVDGVPTLWSSIIEKYSQLCISHMDVLAEVPIRTKILCENQQGFFPNVPESLLVQ